MVLTLVSGVATSYIVLRSLDRQLEIARATAAKLQRTRCASSRRASKHGIISKTRLTQVRSQVQQALAAIPQFQAGHRDGEPDLDPARPRARADPVRGKSIDQLAPQIPRPPAALLRRRRPDILGAEQNLVAANANIGAARAYYRTCRAGDAGHHRHRHWRASSQGRQRPG